MNTNIIYKLIYRIMLDKKKVKMIIKTKISTYVIK